MCRMSEQASLGGLNTGPAYVIGLKYICPWFLSGICNGNIRELFVEE
jgi:hypothetical protein